MSLGSRFICVMYICIYVLRSWVLEGNDRDSADQRKRNDLIIKQIISHNKAFAKIVICKSFILASADRINASIIVLFLSSVLISLYRMLHKFCYTFDDLFLNLFLTDVELSYVLTLAWRAGLVPKYFYTQTSESIRNIVAINCCSKYLKRITSFWTCRRRW